MQNHLVVIVIGVAASVLSAFCMLPQLIKIVKEKSATDISIPMLLTLISGLSLWIVYGCLRKDFVIVAANSISVLINLLILVFAIKYKLANKHNSY